jgi:hypothetical protein
MRLRRDLISGSAGILFVVLSLGAAQALGDTPTYDDEGAAIAAWYADHSTRFLVAHTTAGLVFLIFYIPFLAGLSERLREAEGLNPIWSTVAFAGGILCPAAGTARGLFATAPALLGGDVSPEIASFAMAAGAYGLIVSGAMSGVLMGGASVLILGTRALWIWLGWLGGAAAIASFLSLAAIIERDPEGPFALLSSIAWLAFFVWIAGTSVALMRPSVKAWPSTIRRSGDQ